MRQRRGRGTAVLTAGAVAATLFLTLVARILGGAGSRSGLQSGGPSGPDDDPAKERLASVELGATRAAATRENVAAPGTVSPTALQADAVSPGASSAIEGLEKKKEELRVAMESALLGMIDPGTFLDAALLFTELEVAPKPGVPEPDGAGRMHYPVLGTPEGIRAELIVARTRNESFANPVLGLRLQLDPPKGPYLVEGALRQGPEATVTIWTDPTGAVKHVGVLTEFQPAPGDPGLTQSQAFIPFSASYTLDPETLSWTSNSAGIQSGSFHEQEVPMTLAGRSFPQAGELEHFSSGLSLMYESLKSE